MRNCIIYSFNVNYSIQFRFQNLPTFSAKREINSFYLVGVVLQTVSKKHDKLLNCLIILYSDLLYYKIIAADCSCILSLVQSIVLYSICIFKFKNIINFLHCYFSNHCYCCCCNFSNTFFINHYSSITHNYILYSYYILNCNIFNSISVVFYISGIRFKNNQFTSYKVCNLSFCTFIRRIIDTE